MLGKDRALPFSETVDLQVHSCFGWLMCNHSELSATCGITENSGEGVEG